MSNYEVKYMTVPITFTKEDLASLKKSINQCDKGYHRWVTADEEESWCMVCGKLHEEDELGPSAD